MVLKLDYLFTEAVFKRCSYKNVLCKNAANLRSPTLMFNYNIVALQLDIKITLQYRCSLVNL